MPATSTGVALRSPWAQDLCAQSEQSSADTSGLAWGMQFCLKTLCSAWESLWEQLREPQPMDGWSCLEKQQKQSVVLHSALTHFSKSRFSQLQRGQKRFFLVSFCLSLKNRWHPFDLSVLISICIMFCSKEVVLFWQTREEKNLIHNSSLEFRMSTWKAKLIKMLHRRSQHFPQTPVTWCFRQAFFIFVCYKCIQIVRDSQN